MFLLLKVFRGDHCFQNKIPGYILQILVSLLKDQARSPRISSSLITPAVPVTSPLQLLLITTIWSH